MSNKHVIEINGVKMEIDLRHAKRIDTMRVGDRVKVLTKHYGNEYKINAGTIIGFEPFKELPTIIVAYLDTNYAEVTVKFLYFNAASKDVEIVASIDEDALDVNKAGVLAQMDRAIQKKEDEVADLKLKREFFLANFRAYWPEHAPVYVGGVA